MNNLGKKCVSRLHSTSGFWGRSLLNCSLVWPGQLGVFYVEYLCPPPAVGCKHSGDVVPLQDAGERGPSNQGNAHLGINLYTRSETEFTYFLYLKSLRASLRSPNHLGKGASSSGSPTMRPTSPLCLLVLAASRQWAGRSRAQDSKQTLGPDYCPIILPRIKAIQSSGARRRWYRGEGLGCYPAQLL